MEWFKLPLKVPSAWSEPPLEDFLRVVKASLEVALEWSVARASLQGPPRGIRDSLAGPLRIVQRLP